MGQRFQILVEMDKKLSIYHCQWLWGEYAIRRLGSFVYALQEKIKHDKYFDGSRDMDKCLQWAFLYNLLDQNSVSPYFEDYKWFEKELGKAKSVKELMESLDNNNGQFYLKIKDDKIVGYAFYNPVKGYNSANKKNQGKLIDWKKYIEDYEDEKLSEKFDKAQFDELKRGEKIFEKLKLLDEFPDINDFREEKGQKSHKKLLVS